MFGGKDSREQDPAEQYDARQGTLFPNDHPHRPDEGLKLHHYFIGGVLIVAMLGVLVTGYFYSRSLVIKEPKEETVAAAPTPQPATAPDESAAPAQKAEAPIPPQSAPAAEKAPLKPEAVAEKEAPKAKLEATPAAEKIALKPEAAAEKKTSSPKAESAPKATAAEVYFIQLAAFKDPRQTAQLCKQIEHLGFQCYFGNVDTADGRYWRLRVGPYEGKDKAEGDLAKLQGKGFDGRLIPLKKSGVKAPLHLPL